MLKITLSTASAIAYLIVAMGMASASDETIGPNGINSAGLTLPNGAPLTGAEISIGQVEPGRPIDPDIDVDAINPFIDPEMVFVKDIEATEGQQDDPHPLHVAGVMISSDVRTGDQLDPPDPYPGTATGVAPLANLYASAAGLTSNAAEDFMIATNHVATRDGNEVWAINFSFGHDPHVGQPDLRDGNSQFTLFVDWSASQHDVLYVSAFGEFPKPPTSFSPTDNFNGITVAASTKANGKYSQVASFNDYAFDAEGDRTSVDLIAPGTDFVLASLGGTRQLAGGLSVPNGTSWAAPHVTGTVALLQQYGDYQIDNVGAPQWTANAQRHEVMKAVLMNSADKVEDTSGTGQFLGMERTVLKQNGVDGWFDSDAAFDPLIPLDNEMGVGHLNAKRALQQFAPGEHDFDAGDVPLIGWDYASTSGIPFNFNRYVFEQELTAGDWISITLAWDREVELTVDDGAYNPGDTFVEFTEPDADDVINDLDLYLLPKGATDAGQAVWSSISALGTVEHMFIDILDTGEYEFWVLQNDTDVGAQDYTVAWWYGLAPPIGPPDVTGDFDGDGDVDGRDFLAWQRNPSVGNLADWQNNYGMGTLAGLGDEPARFAVPEPGCLLLLLPIAFLLRRRNAAC